MAAYAASVERLRIGELLLRAKLISAGQLEDALTLQRAQGRKLGQVLIDLGIVNETQLTQTLGQQLSVPWVSLYHIDFSRQLLNLVPRDVAERYCLIPIFVRRVRNQGETLYVAMDDPTNEAAIEAVRASSSLATRPMIAAQSDIRSAIRVYYETGEPEPLPSTAPEIPGSPMTVRSSAARIAAPTEPSIHEVDAPEGPTVADATHPTAETVEPSETAPPSAAVESSAASSGEPESSPASSAHPSDGDSPDAWPEVEAHTIELPKRKRNPKMMALTLLDGTAIELPSKPRRARTDDAEDAGVSRRESTAGPQALADMTARDLIQALDAVAAGAEPRDVFGEKVPIEAICSSVLSVLLRKGLIADWEFVEELRKRR